ncbi:clavaminate synthase-like protein At3g21360 [Salvia hispanica]|uniref:clavaminate synthase-like protein At3g21360 n=1 Tax=Salvia hispanica TaxID=49212 RepID=UPI0020091BD2|nr:clavaminate synthase-like protein At3g21360 [Salvia hispanica]
MVLEYKAFGWSNFLMVAAKYFFTRVKTPFQRKFTGETFPAVLSPAMPARALPAAVKEEKSSLESLLQRHGAILFRGFDSTATAADFNDVVEAFSYEELPYVGGPAPRTGVVGRVFTANDAPPHRKIHFHHEMAHLPLYPRKLFFFCEEEAASGGKTPILLSHIVYVRMKEKYPDFVEKIEELGLMYTRFLEGEDDTSSALGRGWKSMFRTTNKIVAQQRAAKLIAKLEWTENGVKMTVGPVPGIKGDETRPHRIWFNSMVAAYTAEGGDRNDPKKTGVSFGDGEPLPENIILDCMKIMEEESIDIPWQKGDILLIDNLAVLHSRKPFTPPRRILAALCN